MSRQREDTRVVAPIAMILEFDGETKACFTRNISRGGLFALTDQRPPTGARVGVVLTHRKNRLSSSAEVVSITGDGVGLHFVDTTPEFAAGVGDLIETLVAVEGGDVAARGGAKPVGAGAAWAYPVGDHDTESWQKTVRSVRLQGLSLDGAAVITEDRPKIGETILFFLSQDQSPETTRHCQAHVARHLDNGFALRFIEPPENFLDMVGELRRMGASAA